MLFRESKPLFKKELGQILINPEMSMVVQILASSCISDTSNRSGSIGLRIKRDYWVIFPKVRDVHGGRSKAKV
jgi:hypothetical protein